MPHIMCIRSPHCDEILKSGECLRSLCSAFCQTNAPEVGNLCSAQAPLDWKTYATSMRSLPCVRKFWGEARASVRQSGSDYNGLLVALTKMKPYVAKALLENPNPENIALNNAYESEVKCANLQARNYSRYGHAVCNPSNKMDYTIQAAQHTLARIEQAKGNDLSSNDLSCKEPINVETIWHKILSIRTITIL